MKAAICDQCQQQVPPDSYGGAPAGWFSLYERYPSKRPTPVPPHGVDLCSIACLVEYTKELKP